MTKPKNKLQLEAQDKLSKLNNSLRWFCVEKDFECKTAALSPDWYEKVGSSKTKNDHWIHTIKSRTLKEYFKLSDVDYVKIITKFKNKNKHLIL
jgi:hypothetical protein